MGVPGEVFCLLSDEHVFVNSRFVWDDTTPDGLTWLGDVGIQVCVVLCVLCVVCCVLCACEWR